MRFGLWLVVLVGCAGPETWDDVETDGPDVVELPWDPVGRWTMTESKTGLRDGSVKHWTYPHVEVDEDDFDGPDCVRTYVHTPYMLVRDDGGAFLSFQSTMTEEDCEGSISNEYWSIDYGWSFRSDRLLLENELGRSEDCGLQSGVLYCVDWIGDERWYVREDET